MDEKTKEERGELFKRLLNAYTLVAKVIIASESAGKEEGDEVFDDDGEYKTQDQGYEEIEFQKEEYKEVNMFCTNTKEEKKC